MDNNQDNIEPYQDKSFEELVDEFKRRLVGAGQLVPLIFEKGRKDGLSDEEIKQRIIKEAGIPYRTMIKYVPEGSKRKYERYQQTESATWHNQAQLADVTPVTLPPPEQPIIEAEFNQQVREEVTQSQPRKHEECFLPLPLADQLNKFLLARMIGMAKSNGDNSIKFKINNEGELYLP